MIGRREGIGRILGEGSRRAAEALGGAELTIEVKGLEMAFHDPRAHVSMAPNYATASRGADHLDSLSYFIGRGVPAPGGRLDAVLADVPHAGLGQGTEEARRDGLRHDHEVHGGRGPGSAEARRGDARANAIEVPAKSGKRMRHDGHRQAWAS